MSDNEPMMHRSLYARPSVMRLPGLGASRLRQGYEMNSRAFRRRAERAARKAAKKGGQQ